MPALAVGSGERDTAVERLSHNRRTWNFTRVFRPCLFIHISKNNDGIGWMMSLFFDLVFCRRHSRYITDKSVMIDVSQFHNRPNES
jgi:hypothetical protein